MKVIMEPLVTRDQPGLREINHGYGRSTTVTGCQPRIFDNNQGYLETTVVTSHGYERFGHGYLMEKISWVFFRKKIRNVFFSVAYLEETNYYP